MTLDDSASLVDRLDVRYNSGDSYDEDYDEAFAENDDESYDEPGEFFNPFSAITQGISAVGRIIGGGVSGAARGVQLSGVRPNLPSTSGIQGASNLLGQLTNQAGRNFQFRLPQNVATKEDVATLKKAIDAHNTELRKVSDTITKNAQETAKIASEVNRVDGKHTKATGEQNKVLRTMGTQLSKVNKRTSQLRRELQETKQQNMMMMLLPMMMGQDETPKLESVTFASDPGANTVTKVSNSTYAKSDDDNSMMPLMMMMMMMGGMGGSSGSSGGMDSMMMPLMIMMMNK